MVLVPERNYGFVVLANLNRCANYLTAALSRRLIDRLEGGEQRPWSATMLERAREAQETARAQVREVEESRVGGTTPSLPLADYAGVYENQMYGEISVTEENGGLTARFGTGYAGRLEHWHYDTFRSIWGHPEANEFLRFDLGSDGKVASLHAEIEGSVEFKRR